MACVVILMLSKARTCCVQDKMADPAVSGNPTEFQKVAMAAAELQERVDSYDTYCRLEQELADAKEMLKDSDGASYSDGILGLCLTHALAA